MGKKTDIEAQINTINTGGNNTATEVRNVFGTNANSILEAIYGIPKIDNTVDVPNTEVVFTKSGTSLVYETITQKVGRSVTISGYITNATDQYLSNAEVFDITLDEYLSSNDAYYCVGQGSNNYNYGLKLDNNTFSFETVLAPTITVKFSLTYNTIA